MALIERERRLIMARKPTGNPSGRPRKQIDKSMFNKLRQAGCTKDQICSVFCCDDKTLTRWCKDVYGKAYQDAIPDKEPDTNLAPSLLKKYRMHVKMHTQLLASQSEDNPAYKEKELKMSFDGGEHYIFWLDEGFYNRVFKQTIDELENEIKQEESKLILWMGCGMQ
jgi:AraC-like DNA-binding protein